MVFPNYGIREFFPKTIDDGNTAKNNADFAILYPIPVLQVDKHDQ